MVRWLIFLFGFGFVFCWLRHALTQMSEVAHHMCLSWVGYQTASSAITRALVCAQPLDPSSFKHDLQDLGLIHFFVVSGLHLLILEAWFKRLSFGRYTNQFLHSAALLLVMVSQFQAPLTRAWFSLSLRQLSDRWSLHLPAPTGVLFSVLFTLLSQPEHFRGLSLPLSWAACVGLQFGRSTWHRSLFCSLATAPLLASFTEIPAWGFGLSFLLSPLISSILFPLTLLSGIFPPLAGLVAPLWSLTQSVLQSLSEISPPPLALPGITNKLGSWLYPLSLNLLLLVVRGKGVLR